MKAVSERVGLGWWVVWLWPMVVVRARIGVRVRGAMPTFGRSGRSG